MDIIRSYFPVSLDLKNFPDRESYLAYAEAFGNVCNLLVDSKRGVHCGSLGSRESGYGGSRCYDAHGGVVSTRGAGSCGCHGGEWKNGFGQQGGFAAENQGFGGNRESDAEAVRESEHFVGDSGENGKGDGGFGNVSFGRGDSEVSHGVSGVFEVRGKHHEKNKKKRAMKRSWRKTEEVQDSLKEKWLVENRLATLKASQNIAIMEKRDLDEAARLQRTRVARRLEQNLVDMEKSHSFLKSTGNVPGVGGQGFAETVTGSDPSLSISPSSSISQSEVRRLQKENEDLKEREAKAVGYLKECGVDFQACLYRDKSEWTDNSENIAVLDDLFPDGFLKHVVDEDTGKFVPC